MKQTAEINGQPLKSDLGDVVEEFRGKGTKVKDAKVTSDPTQAYKNPAYDHDNDTRM